ncbi:hemerythrin domain-containing protein [Ramlibacter sp.]|uniref:hemerythrin domain-containing protein n=1 Tax=Ramlibacter sp. TaxID=1917967 RepID=UPI002C81643A|nr:hemerythrin domain-containing protein [Ramlibacter sp.]HWI80868.1 hemerythrin domain-containing protein [Ramlibacter sp.]
MSQPIRMSSLLSAGPAPGFEQPFEMLAACHERVARMLALLARLREHLAGHGADQSARDAARDVMRYFDQAAPQHHRDEELHVFPPLLAAGEPQTVALVRRLQRDHVQMEARWQQARQVLARIQAGELPAPSPEDDAALDAFAGLYDDHIQAEEGTAYPAAAAVLGEAAQRAMGEEMMRRRGVR